LCELEIHNNSSRRLAERGDGGKEALRDRCNRATDLRRYVRGQTAAFDQGLNTFVFIFYRQAASSLLLLPVAFFLERYIDSI
jgi:hypothetical protein